MNALNSSNTEISEKVIELSDLSIEGNFMQKLNESGNVDLLSFLGFGEWQKKVGDLIEKEFNEIKTARSIKELPQKKEDRLKLFKSHVGNIDSDNEQFDWHNFQEKFKDKEKKSELAFIIMDYYISNSYLINETSDFMVYGLMNNLDYYGINNEKKGFLDFFKKGYQKKDIKDIIIETKDCKEEVSITESFIKELEESLGENSKIKKNDSQLNNELILTKFQSGIFHFSKYFDDINELKDIYKKIVENKIGNVYLARHRFGSKYLINELFETNWINSKDDVYKYIDFLSSFKDKIGHEVKENRENREFFGIYINIAPKWDLKLLNIVFEIKGLAKLLNNFSFNYDELSKIISDKKNINIFNAYGDLKKEIKKYFKEKESKQEDKNNDYKSIKNNDRNFLIKKYKKSYNEEIINKCYKLYYINKCKGIYKLNEIIQFLEKDEFYLDQIDDYVFKNKMKKIRYYDYPSTYVLGKISGYEFNLDELNKFIRNNLEKLRIVADYFVFFKKYNEYSFSLFLSLTKKERKRVEESYEEFEEKGLQYKEIDLISYSKYGEKNKELVIEYNKLFITTKQKEYFSVEQYINSTEEQREFIKQSLKYLKQSFIKSKQIPKNIKTSAYFIDKISENSKDKVLELLKSEKEIPNLKDVFKKKYQTNVLVNSKLNLQKNELDIIEYFLSNFIDRDIGNETNKYSEINEKHFSLIDEYIESIIKDMEKYHNKKSQTYKILKNYIEYDIDKTDLYEEIAIITLVLKHFKDKKLKNIFSKIIINNIFAESPHIYNFINESKQDNLEKYKYIAIIGEIIDEINLYSQKVGENLEKSEVYYNLFLNNKDKKKMGGINISKEIFNLVYKNLNFEILEEKINLLRAEQYIEKSMELKIYGSKNELDFAFSEHTCVSGHKEELYNKDFIPLRITDKNEESIIGYIWLKESYIENIGKVLVLTDIQPIMKYRGYFNSEDLYKKCLEIIKKYTIDGGYKQLVLTTVNGAQSNDPSLAKVMRKDFKNKDKLKLHKKVCVPEKSSYDISEVVAV